MQCLHTLHFLYQSKRFMFPVSPLRRYPVLKLRKTCCICTTLWLLSQIVFVQRCMLYDRQRTNLFVCLQIGRFWSFSSLFGQREVLQSFYSSFKKCQTMPQFFGCYQSFLEIMSRLRFKMIQNVLTIFFDLLELLCCSFLSFFLLNFLFEVLCENPVNKNTLIKLVILFNRAVFLLKIIDPLLSSLLQSPNIALLVLFNILPYFLAFYKTHLLFQSLYLLHLKLFLELLSALLHSLKSVFLGSQFSDNRGALALTFNKHIFQRLRSNFSLSKLLYTFLANFFQLLALFFHFFKIKFLKLPSNILRFFEQLKLKLPVSFYCLQYLLFPLWIIHFTLVTLHPTYNSTFRLRPIQTCIFSGQFPFFPEYFFELLSYSYFTLIYYHFFLIHTFLFRFLYCWSYQYFLLFTNICFAIKQLLVQLFLDN